MKDHSLANAMECSDLAVVDTVGKVICFDGLIFLLQLKRLPLTCLGNAFTSGTNLFSAS
jgi:hypothetical protein